MSESLFMKSPLLKIFSVVYLLDVIVLFINFILLNYNSIFNGYIFNSIVIWIIFRFLIYLGIIIVFYYLSHYSIYWENIFTSVTIIYGIVLLNDFSSVLFNLPLFAQNREFYSMLETGRIEVIP